MSTGAGPGGRLVVPAYFHPAVAAADWETLARHAGSLRAVILNVHDGPGTRTEPSLAAVAARVAAPLLGYVDTGYATRPVPLVVAEVARYLDWYPVAGVFLDQVSTSVEALPHYERLAAAVRGHSPGQVVFNHGAHPHPGYAALADAMVTFEGPESAYRRLPVPAWTRSLPADRFWHLVYATDPSRLTAVLARAAAGHAATVYVTDRAGANPWDGLPSYLAAEATAWRRLWSTRRRWRPAEVAS